VSPHSALDLKHLATDDHRFCVDKETGKKQGPQFLARMDQLQNLLYANKTRSLLIILQGMDASGKDGAIRHLMSGINPQSCQVAAFKAPTEDELAHDFLWRVHQKAPPKGYIGIFNRSHYEDVLVPRVHHMISGDVVRRRFKDINHFEKLLTTSGTAILKFFLHISKDEQRKRLEERIENPQKRWKLAASDLADRKNWKAYQQAHEEAMMATNTPEAPWYVIPSDHKWYRNWVLAQIIVQALEAMKLKTPKPDPAISFKNLKVR
jgi:PPK2 family polyphosphate:nucleotide phosphotransferase